MPFIDWPDTLLGKNLYFFISLLGHFSFVVFLALYLAGYFSAEFFIIKNHRTFRGLTVIIATICNHIAAV